MNRFLFLSTPQWLLVLQAMLGLFMGAHAPRGWFAVEHLGMTVRSVVLAPASDIEVVIRSGDGRVLAGTLTLPSTGAAPFPVVVTITGSGAHFRDGNRTAADPYRPFREIAASLARRGIATLRLDDRGVGGSTGDAGAAGGVEAAEDVRVAVAWLRRHPAIDAARIGLIGHSFGGVVAPIVAAADTSIGAVVLMGAPARNFRETMRYQLAFTIGRDARIHPADRSAALDSAARVQERNARASRPRWRSWLQDYDPIPAASRVRRPVLIVQGTTDRAVPLEDGARLESTMRRAGNVRVTRRILEGLNHHFQSDPVGAREGYGDLPTQELAPEFLQVMGEWLARTFELR